MCFSLSKITEKKDEPGKLEVIDYGEPLDEPPADLVSQIEWSSNLELLLQTLFFMSLNE